MKKISKKTLNHTQKHIMKNNIWGGVIPQNKILQQLKLPNQ